MNSQPKAIVLGGTNPHIELIKNLKRRGYYTVLVDYYENPPAKHAADQHIQESTLDLEKVLKIAKDIDAKLVISACVDQANVTACYVAEKLGLPAPYSYETALSISNKGLMKKIMVEKGVPTSKHIYTNNLDEFNISGLKFPVVVKPADCCASKGVKRANNMSELEEYFKDAINFSRVKKSIIEEFIEGLEISVYAFIKDKESEIIMISERMSKTNNLGGQLCYATITPSEITKVAKEKILNIINVLADSFKLCNTPFHIQALIKEENVSIIEFAPRVGGGVSYYTIKENTGFDIINATVDSYLGLSRPVVYSSPKCYYAINLIYANPGVFNYIAGFQDLIKESVIEKIYQYKTKNMNINKDSASNSRVGSFIVRGNNKQEIINKTKLAIDRLEVYDINGRPVMRKDIYLQDMNKMF